MEENEVVLGVAAIRCGPAFAQCDRSKHESGLYR